MISPSPSRSPRRVVMQPTAMAAAVALTLCNLTSLCSNAIAQTSATPPVEIEKIVVTGSSIKRVDAEGALPITVITREDIDKDGAITAADLLRKLTVSTSSGVSQGGNRGGATPGGESIALRELTANATLVLLNGRRLPNYPLSSSAATFVSLDSIPAAAISRIEILRDGASSIYGSDAIAGVVNFITRKSYQGIEGAVRYGDAQRGNPREITVSLAGGFGNLDKDGYNALVTLEHLDRTILNFSERSYANNSDTRSRGGYDRRFFFSLPSNAVDLGTGDFLLSPACPQASRKGGLCYTDYLQFISIVPSTQRTNLSGIFTVKLGNGVEAFGELLAGQQESRSTGSPDILLGAYTTNASARGNPFGAPVVAFGLIPGTPLREEFVKSDSVRAMVGARGSVGSLDWEAALSNGQAKTTSKFTGQFIAAATEAALLNGAISPFGTVTNDPTQIAAILSSNDRSSTVKTTELDGRVTMPVFKLPAGSLDVSAGASFRRELLNDLTDPKVSTLANGIDYGRRDGSRNISAAYIEALAPVLSSVEVQVSARYDRYSDFGGTTNPKLALRWKALPNLAFRASASSGFRAPSLAQLVSGNTGGFANGVIDPRRCPVTNSPADCGSGSVPVQLGGNQDLKPETSRSWSAGTVFQLGRDVDMTIDHFNIDYRDQIFSADTDTILANELTTTGNLVSRRPATPADVARGIPGPLTLIRTVPANLARSKISGWDVEIKARMGAGAYGNFVWSGAVTYNGKVLEQLDPSTPLSGFAGTFNRPRVRGTSALDWAKGDWTTRLALRYTGGFTDGIAPGTPAGLAPIKVKGFTQVDAQVGLKAWTGGQLSLGITNLLDTRSPYSNASFSGNSPNGDIIGRAYYVTVRQAFR
jgi:iron complex outermembrane recepter protein